MTIQELARQYADLFVIKTRTDGDTFLTVEGCDNAPLMQLIRLAHDGLMPDDYKYQFIHDALEAIAECSDIDDIHLEADIYNSDLLKWVSSHLERAYYVDEAVESYPYTSFYNALGCGQSLEKNRVLESVRQSLEGILND